MSIASLNDATVVLDDRAVLRDVSLWGIRDLGHELRFDPGYAGPGVLPLVFAVAVLPVVIGLGLVLGAVDVVVVLVLGLPLLVARGLRRRPWRVEATTDEEAVAVEVPGWRDLRAVAADLRAGALPGPR